MVQGHFGLVLATMGSSRVYLTFTLLDCLHAWSSFRFLYMSQTFLFIRAEFLVTSLFVFPLLPGYEKNKIPTVLFIYVQIFQLLKGVAFQL